MGADLTATISIDQDTRDRIEKLAAARDQSVERLIRDALAKYIDREERREAYRREGVEAWREYQETGQHSTFEEVDDWLARLEAGEDAPPPACHG